MFFFLGMLLFPQINYAQLDFTVENVKPNDDLGENDDRFQELFYEALKQKGIENYDRAVEALLQCIELDNSVPVLYFELGKNYNKLKNFGDAEDALKKAVSKAPNNPWFKDELYKFYVQQKEQGKAIKIVKDLIKLRPKYKEELATLLYKGKKYDEALELLDNLDAEFGASYKRDRTRDRIYKLTGRKKEQIKNLENRVDSNPNKESNYLGLIYSYSENNQKEKAYNTAKKLLEINPKSQLVHLALYKFYLEDNKIESAIESMKIVAKSDQVKEEAKQKVIKDFVKFVAKNPKYENDLIDATNLIKNNNNGKTLVELGVFYHDKKDYKKALKYFEEAEKLEEENFIVTKHILSLHLTLEQYKTALEKSNKAIDKYPAQPYCYLINGTALNGLNKAKNAIDTLEAGLDWIVGDNKMTIAFYKEFIKSYNLLNNITEADNYNKKIKALEP